VRFRLLHAVPKPSNPEVSNTIDAGSGTEASKDTASREPPKPSLVPAAANEMVELDPEAAPCANMT